MFLIYDRNFFIHRGKVFVTLKKNNFLCNFIIPESRQKTYLFLMALLASFVQFKIVIIEFMRNFKAIKVIFL